MWKRNPSNKHNARRVQIDGIWFASGLEGRRYLELKLMKVPNLECHPRFPLHANGVMIGACELDFAYSTPDGTVYEDVKGLDNALSRWKRKHVEAEYNIFVNVIGPKQRARRAWMPRGRGIVKVKA